MDNLTICDANKELRKTAKSMNFDEIKNFFSSQE